MLNRISVVVASTTLIAIGALIPSSIALTSSELNFSADKVHSLSLSNDRANPNLQPIDELNQPVAFYCWSRRCRWVGPVGRPV